jgi:hypothetical protein
MKLIQIDNILYIVEGENKYKVANESISALVEHARYNYIGNLGHLHPSWYTDIVNGVDVTDIEHRITRYNTDIGNGEIEMQWHLLPKKAAQIHTQDWARTQNKTERYKRSLCIMGVRYYPIEEIEKAFDKYLQSKVNTKTQAKDVFIEILKSNH